MRYHGLLLAAGKGTRLGATADGIPKALVKVGDDTLVEHNLYRLADAGIDHIVVVVGYMAEQVMAHLDTNPLRSRIEFVMQEETLGTGHAVAISRKALNDEPFVLCYCDNYTPYRLHPLIERHEAERNAISFAVYECENPSNHGILQVEGRRVVSIVERPQEDIGRLAFAGMGVFESDIYEAVTNVKRAKSGEYYLTDAAMDLVRRGRPAGYDVLDCLRVNVNSPAELEQAWNHALTYGIVRSF